MRRVLLSALSVLLVLIVVGTLAKPAYSRSHVPLGVYTEGDLAGYEKWLGRSVNYRLMFPGHRVSWQHARHSTKAILDNASLRAGDKTLVLSLPLAIWGEAPTACAAMWGNLREDADVYDFYTWLGRYVDAKGLDSRYPDGRPKLVFRPGWEMTGYWFPWDSRGCAWVYGALWNLAHHKADTQHVVWEFSISSDADQGEILAAWPGSHAVDQVSMSYYDNGKDENSRTNALPLLLNLSRWFDKPMSLSEVGIAPWSPDSERAKFLAHLGRWVDANQARIAYVSYFEHAEWQLRTSAFPMAAQTFKESFA